MLCEKLWRVGVSRNGRIGIVGVSKDIVMDGVEGIDDWHEDIFERT